MIRGSGRHLRGLSGLAGNIRDRRFGGQMSEVDQLRHPDAVTHPLELPIRGLDRKEGGTS